MAQGPDGMPGSAQAVSQYILQYGMKKAVRAIPAVRRRKMAAGLSRVAGFEPAASSPSWFPSAQMRLSVQLRFAVCSSAVSTLRNWYFRAAETLVVGTNE